MSYWNIGTVIFNVGDLVLVAGKWNAAANSSLESLKGKGVDLGKLGKAVSKLEEATDLTQVQRTKLLEELDGLGDASKIDKFLDDFANSTLLAKFADEPELVKAWDVVANCGDANLAKLANNIDELDVVARHLDDIDATGGYKEWNRILKGSVKNADELLYRLSKIEAPSPEIYKGNFYRTVDNGLDPLHTHEVPRGKSHRYSKPGEDALYFSSSKEGNIQELTHWGKQLGGKTTTYLYRNIESENLLDLTNPKIREQLGISLEQITESSYDFTHVIGTWAQEKYSGIIAPSARGLGENKYFVNIVIFKSSTANSLIKGKELVKIVN